MMKTKDIARALISLVEDDNLDPVNVVDNFMRYVKKYNMEGMAKNVLTVIENEVQKATERKTVYINTAYETSSSLYEKIKEQLKIPSNAPTSVTVQKEMLGGFKILYKDILYEYSLRSRLENLRIKLKE